MAHIQCALDQIVPHSLELLPKRPSSILQSLEVKPDSGTASDTVGKVKDGQILHPNHDHILSLDDVVNVKRSDRYCRCCHQKLSGAAFICSRCGYCLHKTCAKLPLELFKYSLHSHNPLILKFEYLRGKRFVCDVCGRVNHKDCFNYRCQHCRFVIDIKCASLSAPLSRGQRFKKSELYHFSHNHKLQLGYFKKKDKLFCDYCPSQLSGLGYSCSVCDFFLHESCFRQFLLEMIIPFHSLHSFVFMRDPRSSCHVCGLQIYGLGYSCVECEGKFLHSICALSLRRPSLYKFHDHELYYFGRGITIKLRKLGDYEGFVCDKCSGCCLGPFYRCLECKINFHLECVPVPPLIKSRCHRHPVKLAESFTVEGYDPEEQYCDYCEKKRDPRDHAYFCEECSDIFVGHVECVLPKMEIVLDETRQEFAYPCFNNMVEIVFENEPLALRIEEEIVRPLDIRSFEDLHPTKPWFLIHGWNSVQIWNYQLKELQMEKSYHISDSFPVSSKFIALENWIVVATYDGFISVYNDETSEMIHEFVAHEESIFGLVVHPSHPYLLSSSADGAIKLWEWKKGWLCTKKFLGHRPGRRMYIAFNQKDPNIFASGLMDNTLMIWNIASPRPICAFRAHSNEYMLTSNIDFSMSADGLCLLGGLGDNTLKAFNCTTKRCVQTIQCQNLVEALFVHQELPIIITSYFDGTIDIFNAENYRPVMQMNFQLGTVRSIICRKGSKHIVFGCDKGIAVVKITKRE